VLDKGVVLTMQLDRSVGQRRGTDRAFLQSLRDAGSVVLQQISSPEAASGDKRNGPFPWF
jgi:hypothetical protein